jgi:hypothetical protein
MNNEQQSFQIPTQAPTTTMLPIKEESFLSKYWIYIAVIVVILIVIIWYYYYFETPSDTEDEGFLNQQPRSDQRWNIISKINNIKAKQRKNLDNITKYKDINI